MTNNHTPRIPRNFGRATTRDEGVSGYSDYADWQRRQRNDGYAAYNDYTHYSSPTVPASAVEKLLPQNIEAEAGLLGSILIDPEVLPRVTWLDPQAFYREAHRHIFMAMIETLRRERVYREGGDDGSPGDLIQVYDELDRMGKLDEVGGISYVSSLANQVPTSVNWRYYAEIVERCAIYRRVLEAAGKIAAIAYSQPDLPILQSEAMKLLSDALLTRSTMATRWLGTILNELSEQTEARMAGNLSAALFHTGLRIVDDVVGGFDRDELLIVAGRPGAGKSAMGQNILLAMLDEERARAQASGARVGTALYVTLEMSGTRQARRMISSMSGLNGFHIRQGFRDASGDVDDDAWNTFLATVGEADSRYGAQIQFAEESIELERLEQMVARAVLEDNCKIVLIDQLDLLDADDSRLNSDDFKRVSTVVRRLKQIATRYKVLIICLCQLSREAEGVRPEIRHLRATGRIEQDADAIMLLHRPYSYAPDASSDTHWKFYAEAYMAKTRDTESERALPLLWDGQITTFSDWPDNWEIPAPDEDEDESPIARRRASKSKPATKPVRASRAASARSAGSAAKRPSSYADASNQLDDEIDARESRESATTTTAESESEGNV